MTVSLVAGMAILKSAVRAVIVLRVADMAVSVFMESLEHITSLIKILQTLKNGVTAVNVSLAVGTETLKSVVPAVSDWLLAGTEVCSLLCSLAYFFKQYIYCLDSQERGDSRERLARRKHGG